jgi:hypothetical protein
MRGTAVDPESDDPAPKANACKIAFASRKAATLPSADEWDMDYTEVSSLANWTGWAPSCQPSAHDSTARQRRSRCSAWV